MMSGEVVGEGVAGVCTTGEYAVGAIVTGVVVGRVAVEEIMAEGGIEGIVEAVSPRFLALD